MAIKVWNASGLTGGTAGKLDSFAVGSLTTGDRAHVVDSGKFYFFIYDSTATAVENSPLVIRPDSYVSGGNWVLASSPYGDLAIMPEVVSGLPTTGGITGGDITRTAAQTLTITPTSCLDSGLTTKLYTTANMTITAPTGSPWAASTIYHIFIVKLTGGTFEFRCYVAETDVASDAGVSKYRWIGFWRTNGSSNLVIGVQTGAYLLFGIASENVISNAILSTGYNAYSHATMMPESRIELIQYGARDASVTGADILASIDGINLAFIAGQTISSPSDTSASAWSRHATEDMYPVMHPFLAGMLFKASSSTLDLLVNQVKVKR